MSPGTRILLCCLVLATARLEVAFSDQASPPLEREQPSALVLPSETCRGFFILPVTINGSTLELLLDTGSRWTLVDPASLARVTGNRVRAGRVDFTSATVGAHPLGRIRARVLPMKGLARAVGRPIDGILGFPAFEDVLLTLDYPASEVRVATGSLPRPDGREVLRDTGGKRPWVRVRLGGSKVEVLLDSGAVPGYLQIRPGDRVEWAVAPRPALAVFQFGGVAIRSGGRLGGNLGLGAVDQVNPIAFVTSGERLVGWEVMRRLSLTFDQRNKRIRVQPGKATTSLTSPSFVSRGFAARARPEGLEVVKVFSGTPAATAGLREGDLITAIDGVPVYERRCESAHLSAEGTPSRLLYRRDGIEAEAEIRTVTLIP